MGKLSLRRKSDISLPLRHQPSSFSSTDGDSNDFMKRLTSINGDPDDKEKSTRRKSIEDGLPVTHSPTTTTSNKEEFLKRLRSSMASRRQSSFRNSPSSQPAATSRSNSPTIADGSENYPVEEDVEACCSTSEPKALPTKFRLKRFFRIKHLLVIPILLTIGYVVIQYYKVTSLQSELNLSIASRDHLQKSQGTLITELHKYKDTHEKMKKVNNDLSSHLKKLRAEHVEGQKELDKFRNAEKTTTWSEVRLRKFIKGIQDWSKKRVLSKFGKGPYRVELQLLLPTSKNPQFIKLELAPLELMPHAVSTFLEQIDQKRWDGQTFDVHAGHVLLARPDPNNPNSNDASSTDDVPTVMFAEYNEEFPHEKYTVGFPGRPNAGQDFYINLQPNVVHHSPRFEKDEATGEEKFIEGEPCFGKIVDAHSRLVVDEMDKLGFGKEGILENKVVIVSARLIGR